MQRCIYRNFYYIKESIIDFFKCNKKYLFFSLMAMVIGFALAICVGFKNIGCFSHFNITDKIMLSFFTTKSWFSLFVKYAFKYLFLTLLIVVTSSINYVYLINYLIFGYLSFNVVFNSIVVSSLFNLSGTLFVLLCYLPLLILCNFILVIVFLLCKSANNSCCQNSISNTPVKPVILCYGAIIIILLIFSLLSLLFAKFINCVII